ncbi:MAG: hypothetical protein HC889_00540 [Synechococcaceae cyanobacterium SM1_2_3]|nr:hypothetical protein [Synechococcaceae cyanobacterium SM1_2_3]
MEIQQIALTVAWVLTTGVIGFIMGAATGGRVRRELADAILKDLRTQMSQISATLEAVQSHERRAQRAGFDYSTERPAPLTLNPASSANIRDGYAYPWPTAAHQVPGHEPGFQPGANNVLPRGD